MNSALIGSVVATLGYELAGRLHSPTDRVGSAFVNADGREFSIFRETVLDPAEGEPKIPAALFRVQFRVPRIVEWRDRVVIAVKSPIFVALPGFRSKLWMVNEPNRTYQGVYEWDTLRQAEAYVDSASMRFMARVAVPGGLSYEIIPGARIVAMGAALSIGAGWGIREPELPRPTRSDSADPVVVCVSQSEPPAVDSSP
jgi:hypothetical protein